MGQRPGCGRMRHSYPRHSSGGGVRWWAVGRNDMVRTKKKVEEKIRDTISGGEMPTSA
jgi:hypothetical protein